MVINCYHFKESRPPKNWKNLQYGVCSKCALDVKQCNQALSGVAIDAFGGDCSDNDVIYKKLTKKEVENL